MPRYTMRHASYESLCGLIEREAVDENPTPDMLKTLRAQVRELRPELTAKDLAKQALFFYKMNRHFADMP